MPRLHDVVLASIGALLVAAPLMAQETPDSPTELCLREGADAALCEEQAPRSRDVLGENGDERLSDALEDTGGVIEPPVEPFAVREAIPPDPNPGTTPVISPPDVTDGDAPPSATR